MDDANDHPPLESRPPRLQDLTSLCRELNAVAARYVVIGGMAIIEHGLVRATGDIDLLVDASADNVQRIKQAMRILPDNAAAEVNVDDVANYGVVRVADEFVVDLLKAACGVDYAEAAAEAVVREVEGVPIPFASPTVLLKTKRTYREKDALDCAFLRELLKGRGTIPP